MEKKLDTGKRTNPGNVKKQLRAYRVKSDTLPRAIILLNRVFDSLVSFLKTIPEASILENSAR